MSNDIDEIQIDNNAVNGFNPYENVLDHEDICLSSSSEQTSYLNDGYGSNEILWSPYSEDLSEQSASYLNLDIPNPTELIFPVINCFEGVERVNEGLAEILDKTIPEKVKCVLKSYKIHITMLTFNTVQKEYWQGKEEQAWSWKAKNRFIETSEKSH